MNQRNYAKPYMITNLNLDNSKDPEIEHSFIADYDYSFHSSSFMVSFEAKEFEMNDCCHFLLDVDAYPFIDYNNIWLECSLIFSEFRKKSTKEVEVNFKKGINKRKFSL